MADSNIRRLAQLEKFKAAPEALLNQYSITPLPLAVSLKRAVVMAGVSGYIPALACTTINHSP